MLEGSVTHRLNRPAQATIKIPMDCAAGCSGPGERLKITIDGNLDFHGMVMDWELDGDEDMGYITMNAMDPMELWHAPTRARWSRAPLTRETCRSPPCSRERTTRRRDRRFIEQMSVGF